MSVNDVGRLSLNLYVIQHLRIHRGLMPVKCKKLEKGFSYSPDLAKHIRFYTRNTVFVRSAAQSLLFSKQYSHVNLNWRMWKSLC